MLSSILTPKLNTKKRSAGAQTCTLWCAHVSLGKKQSNLKIQEINKNTELANYSGKENSSISSDFNTMENKTTPFGSVHRTNRLLRLKALPMYLLRISGNALLTVRFNVFSNLS